MTCFRYDEVVVLLERIYALAQTDYREQVCQPAARIAEVLRPA